MSPATTPFKNQRLIFVIKSILLTTLILVSSPVPSHAFLWWRDSVPCVRPQKTPTIDGSDEEWRDADEYESDGLSLRAMSDDVNLYLLVEGRGREGLAELSGQYRKDLTFWFVSEDKKNRIWGLRFPFSHLSIHDRGYESPDNAGIEPDYIEMRGPDEISTAMPSDIAFAAGLSGRRSLYELSVPLARIPLKGKRGVLLDIDRDAPSIGFQPGARGDGHRQAAEQGQDEGGSGEKGTGGGMEPPPGFPSSDRGMPGSPGGRGPRSEGSPEIESINMRLKVQLAL